MYGNSYEGVIEQWKLDLITGRARRWGVRRQDLEDAQQQLVLELVAFVYDPIRSNGATETTALVAVIDRRLAMMCRREYRHRQRTERLKQSLKDAMTPGKDLSSAPSDERLTCLAIDVREVVEDLPPLAQHICTALADGQSVNEIARRLGIGWRAVRQQMDAVRGYFQYVGLGSACGHDKHQGAIA